MHWTLLASCQKLFVCFLNRRRIMHYEPVMNNKTPKTEVLILAVHAGQIECHSPPAVRWLRIVLCKRKKKNLYWLLLCVILAQLDYMRFRLMFLCGVVFDGSILPLRNSPVAENTRGRRAQMSQMAGLYSTLLSWVIHFWSQCKNSKETAKE